MSNVTFRNVCHAKERQFVTLRNVTAHAWKSTGHFTACAKARDFSVVAANDYTEARTVVYSWRARRRVACAPPPMMKGVWCIAPGLIREHPLRWA